MDVLDFELTKKDMRKADGLDSGQSELIDYLQAASAEMLNRLKVHD
ncbi:hypothetical protein ACINKY_17480 [Paenibacillus illinoisensis]|uniref:Uncharacterized protein n=1 Tax=Paenibacillus illinoisensis TaxID=59845 RepID=A0ABW8HWD9_9BACL